MSKHIKTPTIGEILNEEFFTPNKACLVDPIGLAALQGDIRVWILRLHCVPLRMTHGRGF